MSGLTRSRFAAFLFLTHAAVALAADPYYLGDQRLALIEDPWRIELRGGESPITRGQVEQAIKDAAASKGWSAEPAVDGRMELVTVVRNHSVRLEATYDDTGYDLRYLRSVNLLYRERALGAGKLRAIHRSYHTWVRDLVTAINSRLGVPAETTVGFAPIERADAVPYLKNPGRQVYAKFLAAQKPRAFAIAPDGRVGWAYRASVTATQSDVAASAVDNCGRGGAVCTLYAIDDRVVWPKTLPARALGGAELEKHVRLLKKIEANADSRLAFTLSVSAEGKVERVCKACPVENGAGTMATRSEEALVCFQWEKITYPDSGCFKVVPAGTNAFVMRGTKGERPIRYSLAP